MPFTNFPNGITSMGVPVVGASIPTTKGNIFFVDYTYGDDGRNAKSNSLTKPLKTIARAYDLCTTDNDDVICLIGSATHVLTAMLTVAKNRVHFVGLDGGNRKYGQSSKVNLGLTTAATDIATILVTGGRNTFTNIKFINTNTVGNLATCLYTFVDGGEYTNLTNCEIYKEGFLATTTAAEFVANGDSGQYINCTFGSLANAQTGTTIRPSVLFTKGVAGTGLVARDVSFIGCNFWKSAGHVNGRHVYGANATDIERIATFENCTFVNAANAAAVPAQCVGFAASLTVGAVLIRNCSSINNTKLSTTTGVFVDGAVPTAATTGIAVQGA